MNEKLSKYPSTDHLRIKDTIGVPHPYCVTPKHVVEASDHFCGMLGKEAIRSAEQKGAKCGVKGCSLSYEGHEHALLIEVNHPGELKDVPGLQEFLLSIKEMTEKDGFVGFAFIKGDKL